MFPTEDKEYFTYSGPRPYRLGPAILQPITDQEKRKIVIILQENGLIHNFKAHDGEIRGYETRRTEVHTIPEELKESVRRTHRKWTAEDIAEMKVEKIQDCILRKLEEGYFELLVRIFFNYRKKDERKPYEVVFSKKVICDGLSGVKKFFEKF
jgi:hypothetical protein